jgi:hypothetical protein
MKTVMVILQNAYGVKRGYVPSYEKESFRKCHTGIRLKRAIPKGVSIRIINASPLVGRKAGSNFKPDIEYIEKSLTEIQPCVILACGVNARKGIRQVDTDIPVIEMPHPAYRALTNKTVDGVRQQIEERINDRI